MIIQYVLRAWIWIPSLSISFLKHLSWIRYPQKLKQLTKKNLQITKFHSKNWNATNWNLSEQTNHASKLWKIYFIKQIKWPIIFRFYIETNQVCEFCLSRVVKQPNVENFKFAHEKNRMAKVICISGETIQGKGFWKTSGYFFGRVFSTKNYRFSTEAI